MLFSDDFLDAVRCEVSKSLYARLEENNGQIREENIDDIALNVALDIQFAWAGQQIYVQQRSKYLERRILDEYTGDNVPELVSRYRLSTKTIYSIMARQRAEAKSNAQLMLPGV